MAGNRVVIRFIGDDGSLTKSLAKLQVLTAKSQKGLTAFGNAAKTGLGKVKTGALDVVGALHKMAMAGDALSVVHGLIGAVAQLSGGLLLLPAVLGVAGAAFATLKIGMAGFFDALGPGAAGDKAFAKLSDNAKATVLQLKALAPAWEQVQKATQNALFKGIAADVKALGATYLPVLHKQLPMIAADYNVMAHNAFLALRAPAVKGSVVEILSNTHKLLQAMPHSFSGVLTGFLTLAGAGSKYLVPLGGWIDKLSLKFAHWADGLVSSGKFDTFVKSAGQGLENLIRGAGNVAEAVAQIGMSLSAGMAIADVLAGGSAQNGGPLAFFRDLTQALKDFFAEARTKDALVALGQALGDVAGAAQGVLLAALHVLAPIIRDLAPLVGKVAQAFGTVLTHAISDLGPQIDRFIRNWGPSIVRWLEKLATLIINYVIPAIAYLIDWLASHRQFIRDFFFALGDAAVYAGKVVLGIFAALSQGAVMTFGLLSMLPGNAGRAFGVMAIQAGQARDAAIRLAGGIDQIKPKDVAVTQHGAEAATGAVRGLKSWIDAIPAIKNVLVQVRQSFLGGVQSMLGFRAAGGPVSRGRSYVVGERGPELVTMGGSGYVTPNHALGGGGGAGGGMTVNFTGNTSDALATVIMQMIRTGKIQIQAA